MEKVRVDKAYVFNEVKDYLMITIAMLSYCIGWSVFLLPNNITTGGVPGISSLLFWGLGIPKSLPRTPAERSAFHGQHHWCCVLRMRRRAGPGQ